MTSRQKRIKAEFANIRQLYKIVSNKTKNKPESKTHLPDSEATGAEEDDWLPNKIARTVHSTKQASKDTTIFYHNHNGICQQLSNQIHNRQLADHFKIKTNHAVTNRIYRRKRQQE